MSLMEATLSRKLMQPWLRVMLVLAALAAIAGLAMLIGLFLPDTAPVQPPAHTPFGLGTREATAPAAGGIAALIMDWQSRFYRGLTDALRLLKADGCAATLIGLSFAYGVFHAAGPGHGKGVIAAYIVADGKQWTRGITLSIAAALVQALVAISLVGFAVLVFKATAMAMTNVARWIEMASFAAMIVLGLWLAWRKAGRVLALLMPVAGATGNNDACGHIHLPPPDVLSRMKTLRETAAIVFAAGLRPCTGAIVVLVFALSQGLAMAGIAAVLAMALGTAFTTGAIAAFAVFAKRAALAIAGGGISGRGLQSLAVLELLAATALVALGVLLLLTTRAGTLS
jgi:nickel/cobalt transporter (NicO) family protein